LRVFLALDLRRLGNITVKESSKRQLQLVLRRWLDTHLNLKLKSRSFLDQWERYGDLLGERMKRPEPPQEQETEDGAV
jgi:DNA repair protein RecO (recombination protein O)